MPIIKSAKKRVRTAQKAAVRNSKIKRSLKAALKEFHKALTGGGEKTTNTHNQAQSKLDKAVKKGIIHKNKAARQKRQLAAHAKAAGANTATTAKISKPTTTKKAAAPTKTTAAKKSTPKKTPAKKPTIKK